MRKTRVWIILSCCLFALAVVALAQAIRKPGLWEMTANMTWQQSPLPPGMNAAPGHEVALQRHDHHHAGLPHPGHDRQVRRADVAEPRLPDHQHPTEIHQHERRHGVQRKDERQGNNGVLMDRRQPRQGQDAFCGNDAVWPELDAGRMDGRVLVCLQRPRLRQREATAHAGRQVALSIFEEAPGAACSVWQ